MRCKKQFRFNKLDISHLWEVHLDYDIWERIVITSRQRNCSLTWITRYCVFRLIRRYSGKMSIAMENHSNMLKSKYNMSKGKHRHMLCLYGEDEKLLRMAAMRLDITVSHFIRLAILRFLPEIERFRVNWHQIYYHGTKICRYLDFTVVKKYQMPFTELIFYAKWPKKSWWKRPRYELPIAYTP